MKGKNFHHFSRFTDKGPSIAGVIRTIRHLLQKPVFLKGNADWLHELPSVIKQYNNTVHSSAKMIKSNEKIVYNNLKDDRENQPPKFHLNQLFRTADIKRVFNKGDSTNYSYKLYTNTEVIHDTILSIESTIYPRDIMKIYFYQQNYLLKKTIKL